MFSVNSGFYITAICKMSRSFALITFSRWIQTFLSCSRRLVLNCGQCHLLHSVPFDVVALAITVAVTFANIFSVGGGFCITWFHWMTCSSAPQISISRILMFLSWSSRKGGRSHSFRSAPFNVTSSSSPPRYPPLAITFWIVRHDHVFLFETRRNLGHRWNIFLIFRIIAWVAIVCQ